MPGVTWVLDLSTSDLLTQVIQPGLIRTCIPAATHGSAFLIHRHLVHSFAVLESFHNYKWHFNDMFVDSLPNYIWFNCKQQLSSHKLLKLDIKIGENSHKNFNYKCVKAGLHFQLVAHFSFTWSLSSAFCPFSWVNKLEMMYAQWIKHKLYLSNIFLSVVLNFIHLKGWVLSVIVWSLFLKCNHWKLMLRRRRRSFLLWGSSLEHMSCVRSDWMIKVLLECDLEAQCVHAYGFRVWPFNKRPVQDRQWARFS